MDRTACVDLPAFPLQLLLRRQPEDAPFPCAVVEEDRPQARVLWACEKARAYGILPGMRYGQALALTAELRAGVVGHDEIRAGIEGVAEALRRLSPDVEPCESEPGVFWLSGIGLSRIFPSASAWGRKILETAQAERLTAGVAVGFARFATYAVARARPKLSIFRDAGAEMQAAHAVPLDRLSLSPELRDAVARLGVHTLGAYLALPPSGLLLRFGREAQRLHELAAGARWDPLQAVHPLPALAVRADLEEPEENAEALLFLIKRELQRLLRMLADRKQAVRELTLLLQFSDAFGEQREQILPAAPTLDDALLLRLVHLRISAQPPRAAVRGIALFAEAAEARPSQVSLFLDGPRRDARAAGEALAQLRAELGESAVRCARLRDGHLPEAQFEWAPMPGELPVAQPARTPLPVLVRRIFETPQPVAAVAGNLHDDGWLLCGLQQGAVLRFHGPYLSSGGWWKADPAPPLAADSAPSASATPAHDSPASATSPLAPRASALAASALAPAGSGLASAASGLASAGSGLALVAQASPTLAPASSPRAPAIAACGNARTSAEAAGRLPDLQKEEALWRGAASAEARASEDPGRAGGGRRFLVRASRPRREAERGCAWIIGGARRALSRCAA